MQYCSEFLESMNMSITSSADVKGKLRIIEYNISAPIGNKAVYKESKMTDQQGLFSWMF